MNNCLNCNHPLVEGQNYCGHCGQKAALKRLNLHDIWHDVIHYFTHADKGIFQLLKSLVTQTGIVAKEFVNGKRKKYFPPLNFFLIVAALYVFMGSVFSYKPSAAERANAAASYQSAQAKTASPAYTKASQKNANVYRFFAKYANFVAMFAAPFISLLIWLIYRKGPYNFTEHLVANLYLIGFTNLVRCMVWTPSMTLLHIHPRTQWPNYAYALFEIGYRTIFYYKFMDEPGTKGKLKAFGLAVLTAITWWVAISGFIYIYMMLN